MSGARLRARFGEAVGPYTDLSALFVLHSLGTVRDGGVVAMIQPRSFLVSRDAAGARAEAANRAVLEHLWLDDGHVFGAGVRVCVPVLRRSAEARPRRVRRSIGLPARRLAPMATQAPDREGSPSWGYLSADASGVPPVVLPGGSTLGEWCTATAGFRDEFYGLVPFVHEVDGDFDGWARLVTSGLVDVARCRWGEQPTRFAKRRWVRPAVDVDALRREPRLHAWVCARLVPKVVLATQTRIIEGAVDDQGTWVPSVPTIAVTPTGADLWAVAAVLLAPPVSAWALTRSNGAALAVDHLRLAASQIPEIPLPPDLAAVGAGARLLQEASAADGDPLRLEKLSLFGDVMCEAYGVDRAVLGWWQERLR